MTTTFEQSTYSASAYTIYVHISSVLYYVPTCNATLREEQKSITSSETLECLKHTTQHEYYTDTLMKKLKWLAL